MEDPLHWNLLNRSLKEIKANAEQTLRFFPSIKDPKEALKAYAMKYKIQGIIWTEEDGERYVWGPDVKNLVTQNWRKNTRYTYFGVHGRKYEVLIRPLPLAFIDQPSSKEYRILSAHTCEKQGRGWNLPTHDEHHFLRFPTEIIIRILEFILMAPKDAAVRPMTVTSNWKRTYTTPSFYLLDKIRSRRSWCKNSREYPFKFTETSRLISWVSKADADGSYTLKREIILPVIDASVLRTCRTLYEIGSKILYGSNQFDFNTHDEHNETACPPRTLLMGRDYHPQPDKPQHYKYDYYHNRDRKKDGWQGEIKEGITQISLRRPITILEGYVYHDPFLRFLRTIGPKNASLIRNLVFTGTMMQHSCDYNNNDCSHKCSEDLATSMEAYTAFIQEFCKGLQTLTVFPLKDEFWGPNTVSEGEPQNFEEAVSQMVRGSVSKIKVDTLFVFEHEKSDVQDIEEYDEEDVEDTYYEEWVPRNVHENRGRNVLLGFEMEEWTKARNENQHTQKEEETACPGKDLRRYTDPKCDFCGENHVWPDCHNLCRVCGEYGHWESLCSRVSERYW